MDIIIHHPFNIRPGLPVYQSPVRLDQVSLLDGIRIDIEAEVDALVPVPTLEAETQEMLMKHLIWTCLNKCQHGNVNNSKILKALETWP